MGLRSWAIDDKTSGTQPDKEHWGLHSVTQTPALFLGEERLKGQSKTG